MEFDEWEVPNDKVGAPVAIEVPRTRGAVSCMVVFFSPVYPHAIWIDANVDGGGRSPTVDHMGGTRRHAIVLPSKGSAYDQVVEPISVDVSSRAQRGTKLPSILSPAADLKSELA